MYRFKQLAYIYERQSCRLNKTIVYLNLYTCVLLSASTFFVLGRDGNLGVSSSSSEKNIKQVS